jgi:hypothetical protein
VRSWGDYPDYYIGLAGARGSSWSRSARLESLRERLLLVTQQHRRIHPQVRRDPLDRLQGEVALATLDRARERAMEAEHLGGERLLTQTARLTMAPQVASNGPLQVAFHSLREAPSVLRIRRQTHE